MISGLYKGLSINNNYITDVKGEKCQVKANLTMTMTNKHTSAGQNIHSSFHFRRLPDVECYAFLFASFNKRQHETC